MKKRAKRSDLPPPLPGKTQVVVAYAIAALLLIVAVYLGVTLKANSHTTTLIPTSVAVALGGLCFALWGALSHYYRRHPNMFDPPKK